ncbi:MAG TPA: RNA methyltransferase [Deltaproteobacteria bacterium]|nr:RNA methyltransferase [Deltaproteobacteria bacterium]HOM28526.1 RNA methyltransferase [Deltaproteobacteria bacterium]HPP81800.1 RNA methyltransferase [Deltaproteobacteria bacterium]
MLTVALIHWPCLDKNGREVATAITNLDIHDCARACLTYGVDTLYIVHPNPGQRAFAERLMDHWLTGGGARYNAYRREALSIVRVVPNVEDIRSATKASLIGTSAHRFPGSITWAEAKRRVSEGDVCMVFGTGWGMARRLVESLDAVVEPIHGKGAFNHLSVRSAVAIALDRVT